MNSKTKKIVLTALFAALTCVATYIIRIPTPTNGYVNLGDCIVLIGGFVLGPVYGAIAGGLGSAMCDLFSGYMIYVPATLIIKALMAFAAGTAHQKSKAKNALTVIFAGLIGEIIMVAGYFIAEALFMGYGLGAAAGIPSNIMQGIIGITAAALLMPVMKKINKVI